MNATPLKHYFERRLKALASLSDAVVHPQPGLSGTARELLVTEFLEAHLPPALKLGNGMIFGHEWANTGRKDRISNQQDVVIYRPDFPVLQVGGVPLFFRESVVGTIEVKTNYKTDELQRIFKNVASVRNTTPVQITTFQIKVGKAEIRDSCTRPVLCGVFYFSGVETRAQLVRRLNNMQDEFSACKGAGALSDFGPDFFFSPQAGLIVKDSCFHTLEGKDALREEMDCVANGLTEREKHPGAYRRVFRGEHDWKGALTVILELTERCQRYAVSYANLSDYLCGSNKPETNENQ